MPPSHVRRKVLTLGSLLGPHAEAEIDEEVERGVEDGEEMVDAHQEDGPLKQKKTDDQETPKLKKKSSKAHWKILEREKRKIIST